MANCRQNAIAILLIAVVRMTYAQQTSGDSSVAGIPEIVVTAQKRTENIQNVPIAVTAITGDDLAKGHIEDSRQLQFAVPSLNYANDTGFAMPFLRGIGSDVSQPGSEPSVATFVDGVYVAGQQGSLLNLLGVDRVEVLAGPQGTLYGRNASGGAINLYTLTPHQELEAQATAGYGNFHNAQLSARISGGLTDQLAIGIYAAVSHQDSIYDFVPGPVPGQLTTDENWGVRLKAVWTPVEEVKLTASFEHTDMFTADNAFRNVQPNALGYLFGAPHIIQPYVISSDLPQYATAKVDFEILREEFGLGFANLVGISSYRLARTPIQTDADGTAAPLVDLGSPLESGQLSQELQLLSPIGSRITWIAGLYYIHERGGYLPLYVNSAILFQPAPFTSSQLNAPEKTLSDAAFAQATFPLDFISTDARLTLGGRYTKDTKTKLPATQSFVAGGVDVIPSIGYPQIEASWTKFTPKVTFEYQTAPALFYVTYAQGYKSGMFNISTESDNTPVQPEQLTDYELGVKSDLFDRRLRVNLAAYHYDFKNLQVQVLNPSGGISAILRNAASAKADGVELNTEVAITTDFTVSLNGAYEHSRYTDFPNAPDWVLSPVGNSEILGVSATGHELQHAPKLVGTASGNYRVPIPDGSHVDLTAGLYATSSFNWDPTGQLAQGGYHMFNSSLAYTSRDQHWVASVWGSNLNNNHHYTFEAISSFGTYAHDDLPRMYGATVTWRTK